MNKSLQVGDLITSNNNFSCHNVKFHLILKIKKFRDGTNEEGHTKIEYAYIEEDRLTKSRTPLVFADLYDISKCVIKKDMILNDFQKAYIVDYEKLEKKFGK